MSLATMLVSPDNQNELNASFSPDFKDLSSAPEQRVAESITQELDYWEKLVFSFDMERDQGGQQPPPHPETGTRTRGRTKKRERGEQTQTANLPPSSSGSLPSSVGTSQQPIDNPHIPSNLFPSHPPMAGQGPNAQLNQLSQLASLDPYTLAHIAALSAIQNVQQTPGAQAAPPDPFAIIRQVQGLLYPFGASSPGNGGALPGVAQGFQTPLPGTSHNTSGGSSRDSAQQGSQNHMTEPSSQNWSSQLPGINTFPFPMHSLDPALAHQLSQLSPLAIPNNFSQPSQTPGAGPSMSGSRARSTSTASTRSPSTPLSPTNSRAASLMDDAAIAEDKRRRNTAASARFRIKKKHKTLALERSVVELEARAEDLEREASELRRENGWLKEMLIMKGRSVRAQASAVAAQINEDDDEEELSGDEEKGDDHEENMELEDASDKKGKGKEKAA